MSDPLAATLAELRRRLEADRPETGETPATAREGEGTDLWQLSELELDRLMGRRLDEVPDLLPVLGIANACAFSAAPDLSHWTVDEFKRFHQRAWAVLQQRDAAHQIAGRI